MAMSVLFLVHFSKPNQQMQDQRFNYIRSAARKPLCLVKLELAKNLSLWEELLH
jgi:hypothetical protein